MVTVPSTVALGFLLGIRHATDADHVAAVAATVGRERLIRPAAWIGVWWGIGHSITIVAVGAAIVLFDWIIEPRLGLAMECGVGLMLVWLGSANLRSGHHHDHHGLERALTRSPLSTILRPIAIGIVHGLAGSAAVTLLVMTTIRNPAWAVAYLLVFGAGTIAGMALITLAIAMPFASLGDRSNRAYTFIRWSTGVVSVSLGLFLAYRIVVVDGLFAAVPNWTPR